MALTSTDIPLTTADIQTIYDEGFNHGYDMGVNDGITYQEQLAMAVGQTPGLDFSLMGEHFGALMIGFVVLFAAAMLLNLLAYVAYGMGMSGIARNEGYSKPWLSWIPIANLFMIPISVEADVHGQLKGRFTKLFGLSYVGVLIMAAILGFFAENIETLPSGVLILLFVVYFGLCLLPTALLGYGFYFIVDRYSERVGLNMVVAILSSGFSVPFQLFRYRNRESLY